MPLNSLMELEEGNCERCREGSHSGSNSFRVVISSHSMASEEGNWGLRDPVSSETGEGKSPMGRSFQLAAE